MEPHDGHQTGDADDVRESDAPTATAPEATTAPVTSARPVDEVPRGNPTVSAALQELATIGQRPLAEHPDSFARVHSGLQQALSDIDDA